MVYVEIDEKMGVREVICFGGKEIERNEYTRRESKNEEPGCREDSPQAVATNRNSVWTISTAASEGSSDGRIAYYR